jgi:hypothetical protein
MIDAELCELGPGSPNTSARQRLEQLTPQRLLDGQIPIDPDAAQGCIAGLWLLHNYLEQSHRISQELKSSSGSMWHGIMHRREPDYANAKYWFRRAPGHPIFPALAAAGRELAVATPADPRIEPLVTQTSWDPLQFVDLCEAAAQRHNGLEDLCRKVAQAEWQLLFNYCYRRARGSSERE